MLGASGACSAPTEAEAETLKLRLKDTPRSIKKSRSNTPTYFYEMRVTGLEPARVFPLEPKSSASANSATPADEKCNP